MNTRHKILILDDEPSIVEVIVHGPGGSQEG
jgi:hypothetical protein